MDSADSPFENAAHEEVRARVEMELRQIPEPYRTTVILRDIEEMSYEEVAEITEVSLGTVKSRLTRGRDALRQRLTEYVRQSGRELGLKLPTGDKSQARAGVEIFDEAGYGGCIMKCALAKSLLSPYLDGALTGKQMLGLTAHLRACDDCGASYEGLRATQRLLADIGRRKAPADLELKLRLAISREAARTQNLRLHGWGIQLRHALQVFMVPASAGLVATLGALRRADGVSGAAARGRQSRHSAGDSNRAPV